RRTPLPVAAARRGQPTSISPRVRLRSAGPRVTLGPSATKHRGGEIVRRDVVQRSAVVILAAVVLGGLLVSCRLTGAVTVAAGRGIACALLADGTVRCWSPNNLGQVGDGTTEPRKAP